tara:strand:- start:97 stop:324 length:228 start_codon:yes stop_codon:yes gene_type:complete
VDQCCHWTHTLPSQHTAEARLTHRGGRDRISAPQRSHRPNGVGTGGGEARHHQPCATGNQRPHERNGLGHRTVLW